MFYEPNIFTLFGASVIILTLEEVLFEVVSPFDMVWRYITTILNVQRGAFFMCKTCAKHNNTIR
jgi:hypothetical protein